MVNVVGNVTPTGAQVAAEADVFFAPLYDNAVNGASTLSGSSDIIPTVYHIPQNIVVNKPSSGSQIKRLGVTNVFNSNTQASGADQYNYDGSITLNDDLQVSLDGNVLNTPSGGSHVNVNFKGSLITGNPSAGTGNITTALNYTGRTLGAPQGSYNNLFVNFNLNGDNSQFAGGFTIGNPTTTFNTNGTANPSIQLGNPDVNHVLIAGSPKAVNGNNYVKFLYDSTLRLNGNTVTMGSIRSGFGYDPLLSTTRTRRG